MNIAEAIISRIIQDGSVTLTQLEQRAQDRAVSLSDLYAALDRVSRDKRIKRGVRAGEVYYEPAPAPKTPIDHLAWVNANYPRYEYEMPFPEISYAHLFLKPAELLEYKAQAKGVPAHLLSKKRYGKTT